MRRSLSVSAVVASLLVLMAAPLASSAATTTTSSVPSGPTSSTVAPLLLCSATTTIATVPGATAAPVAPCSLGVDITTTTTTTTTLPSAVTTVPEGCALPPTAQAVFIGTLTKKDLTSAVFRVTQVRAGSLDGYITTQNTVTIRYGNDVKYLDVGTAYIVGVKQDVVSLKLASSVRDVAELFGGAEVAGSNTKCPEFEDPARTLNMDGSAIPAGIFTKFFDQPWRLVLVVVVPPVVVLAGLVGLVSLKRGSRRQPRTR